MADWLRLVPHDRPFDSTIAPKCPEMLRGFDVRLSIEKDAVAHQTLLLRKFYRAFDEPPDDYFAYVSGRLTRDELFARHRTQHRSAHAGAWCAELGEKIRAL